MNRIKTLAIALGAMLTVCTAQAQSIVKQDATMDDYIKLLNTQQTEVGVQGDKIQLLNNAGFKTFAFDISSMGKNKYAFTSVIKKYEDGKTENLLQMYENFAIYTRATHFNVGVNPINDSTLRCQLYWGTEGFTPVASLKKVHGSYHIVSTPFVLSKELKLGEFIPLLAVSSGWYDEENECVKNCDVVEFDPENYLDTETFKKSPLIYVIGVKCMKR